MWTLATNKKWFMGVRVPAPPLAWSNGGARRGAHGGAGASPSAQGQRGSVCQWCEKVMRRFLKRWLEHLVPTLEYQKIKTHRPQIARAAEIPA